MQVLSILLPYYLKYQELRASLERNHSFLASDQYELIIMVDEPSGVEVRHLLNEYPRIKSRVFENSIQHKWRNPAPVINAGIRRAQGEWILIMSPESIMLSDVPSIFLSSSIAAKERGIVNPVVYGFVSFDDHEPTGSSSWSPYGSIFLERSVLCSINGYNETYKYWGGEDDDLRLRLKLLGCELLSAREARIWHPGLSEQAKNSSIVRRIRRFILFNYHLKRIRSPLWGEHVARDDFHEIH